MSQRDYQIISLMQDNVNSPSHYTAGGIETIDYIDQITMNYDGPMAYSIGNTLKYLSRAPLKGKLLEDLKKAQWYLNHAINKLECNQSTYKDEE